MAQEKNPNAWAAALGVIANHHGMPMSNDMISRAFVWSAARTFEDNVVQGARRLGLTAVFSKAALATLPAFAFPIVAGLKEGGATIIAAVGEDEITCVNVDQAAAIEWKIAREEADQHLSGSFLLLSAAKPIKDARLSQHLASYKGSWFWSMLLADKRRHFEIGIASVIGNLLALGSALFGMQVWDRVVPAQSLPTLWVLASGVIIAVMLEFALRISRMKLADMIGKKVDLTISSMFFARALDIRNDARPKSTGSFIAQLRETETIRESLGSSTLTAAIDMPFAIVFLFVIWMIGGPLILMVLMALPLIIIPGLLLQIPLAKLSNVTAQESALRHAILVESIDGIEDIKSLQAERRFHRLWDRYSLASSATATKQKQYISLYVYWIQSVQQLAYVMVIVAGVYMVLAGEMTTGGVIGCSMLTGRALSPFAQLAQIFTRWQSAKTAKKGLDDLLEKPIDHPTGAERMRRQHIAGDYELTAVEFGYDPEAPANLRIGNIRIKAGERIALVGRNGAGKTTLLKLLGAALPAQKGAVVLDNANIQHLDTSDVRNKVSLLTQESRLFHGSIQENIQMGSPLASRAQFDEALSISGAAQIVRTLSKGLETTVMEGGAGLSGGQKQAIMLARTLLRDPSIVLLDEPTSAMDEASEKQFIKEIKPWMEGRTVVIATHRPALLDLVDRIIVMERGRVVIDDKKEVVLARLQGAAVSDMPQKTAQIVQLKSAE
jgi:ATP-binding cassette subfamily C protein LapB